MEELEFSQAAFQTSMALPTSSAAKRVGRSAEGRLALNFRVGRVRPQFSARCDWPTSHPPKFAKPSLPKGQPPILSEKSILDIPSTTNSSPPPVTENIDCNIAKMSEGGDIEVISNILPKDVAKEVGNVKLFNKWDYDVEVRDISLTYVTILTTDGGIGLLSTTSTA